MDLAGPPPIVAVPAARYPRVRGRRVIIGVPGVGFRGDLRADDAVVQGSRTFIPVLTEQDYYRAELRRIETFAVLVPIDRVWVEEAEPVGVDASQPLDAPLSRQPAAVLASGPVMGRRVIQAVDDGYLRDLRAVSDVHVSHSGTACVRVCAESAWYAWGIDGSTPTSTEVSVDQLWVE
ncbi:MAG TPA: hypothetical protein VH561_05135 [Micromonosporaceae bacterium]|jgi:hypothetical protein